MKRKTSASQEDDTALLRSNAKLAVSNNKNNDLQDHIDDLEAKNEALQSKLDEIHDIVTCSDPECSAEEHLDDIQDVLDGNRNGGGNSHGHDDD